MTEMAYTEAIDSLLEDEDRWHADPSPTWDNLPTGFPSIDRLTGGWHGGDVVILGAATGMGKSSLGNQLVWKQVQLCYERSEASGFFEGRVYLFTPEMRIKQVFARQASVKSGVPSWHLKKGIATDEERARWRKKLDGLRKLEDFLVIAAGDTVSINDIKSAIAMEQEPIKMVAVDYIQRITDSSKGNNAYERVSSISREIKTLANKHEFVFLAMAQLSRKIEDDQQQMKDGRVRKPKLSDLQNTAGLEQDADAVWLIHRYADEEGRHSTRKGETAELIIAKQRDGPQGMIELIYNPPNTAFADRLWKREEEE